MSGLVVLQGSSNLNSSFPLQATEILRDPEDLVERVRSGSGGIAWVAIAPDCDDPAELARRIRAANPAIGVILLGADRDSAADGPFAPGAEKLASIVALTTDIAHDVGTPLTAILGYAELIAKSVGDEKNRKRATTIVAQVHRVRELIENLMNVSRAEERPAAHAPPLSEQAPRDDPVNPRTNTGSEPCVR